MKKIIFAAAALTFVTALYAQTAPQAPAIKQPRIRQVAITTPNKKIAETQDGITPAQNVTRKGRSGITTADQLNIVTGSGGNGGLSSGGGGGGGGGGGIGGNYSGGTTSTNGPLCYDNAALNKALAAAQSIPDKELREQAMKPVAEAMAKIPLAIIIGIPECGKGEVFYCYPSPQKVKEISDIKLNSTDNFYKLLSYLISMKGNLKIAKEDLNLPICDEYAKADAICFPYSKFQSQVQAEYGPTGWKQHNPQYAGQLLSDMSNKLNQNTIPRCK